MIKHFPQYFRPTDDDFKKLWGECLFAFDASVLLNVYGYSDATRDALLKLLNTLKDRVVLPYQFGLEFSRNRVATIVKQIGNCRQALEMLEKFESQHLSRRTDHPFLKPESLAAFKQIVVEIRENQVRLEKLVKYDEYADKLAIIFDNAVTEAFDEKRLKQLHAEGKVRYADLRPPGYADLKEKGEPRAYGDFIGWRQLIEYAERQKRPVILVTDDASDDWWQLEGSGKRTIGPRPELLHEFAIDSKQNFYMYNSFSFLQRANDFLGVNVDTSAVEEVQEHIERIREESSPPKAGDNTRSPLKALAADVELKTNDRKPASVEPAEQVTPKKAQS